MVTTPVDLEDVTQKIIGCAIEVHRITYLKVSGHPAGLLMNFNATTLKAGLKRLDHPDLYVKKIS